MPHFEVVKFRPEAVCAAARLSDNSRKGWIKRKVRGFPTGKVKGSTWGGYTFPQLLTVVAFAEANRWGFSLDHSRGFIKAIESILWNFNNRIEPREPFVIAQIEDQDGTAAVLHVMTATRDQARRTVGDPQKMFPGSSSVLIVDVGQLWESVLNGLLDHASTGAAP